MWQKPEPHLLLYILRELLHLLHELFPALHA